MKPAAAYRKTKNLSPLSSSFLGSLHPMQFENPQQLYAHFNGKEVTERERYKFFTQHDAGIVEFKREIAQLVAKRGLSSWMNDTKWLALQAAIPTLPFPPAYAEKRITDTKPPPEFDFSRAPTYYGDWSPYYNEGMSLFFNIEWLRIFPRHNFYRSHLVNPEIVDLTAELITLLEKLRIPFEHDRGTILIWGYR